MRRLLCFIIILQIGAAISTALSFSKKLLTFHTLCVIMFDKEALLCLIKNLFDKESCS